MSDLSRRGFLKVTGAVGAGLGMGSAATGHPAGQSDQPPARLTTKPGSAAGLTAEPMDTVRIGVIGAGSRGSGHARGLTNLSGAEVKAIAEPRADEARKVKKRCEEAGAKDIQLYTRGSYDYRRLLKRDDIDAVFIATPWRWHAPQGIDTMKAGKHAFIEVPMGLDVDELWQLVHTCEKTQRHCMMMENVCYNRDELMALNMCRKGLFGELLHGEAAYIHDLRSQMNDVNEDTGSWRTGHHIKENGNLYPTHGLGPISQYMSLGRGEDRFHQLVSFSSPARGFDLYAKDNFPADHLRNQVDYKCGDMNTSIVKTQQGRTIMVQWDTSNPRPYTRHNLIQGTRGLLAGFPTRLTVEGRTDPHEWVQGEDLKPFYKEFDHPLWEKLAQDAASGGHGGADYVMRHRIIQCLRNGLPLDQNVYEGASWSVVRPLSKWSLHHEGQPIKFPDFTRGAWKQIEPLGIVS